MNTFPAAGSDHPDEAGYPSPACTCPHCNSAVTRVPRRFVDVLLSAFIAVRRYSCRSLDCGWEGNLRVQKERRTWAALLHVITE